MAQAKVFIVKNNTGVEMLVKALVKGAVNKMLSKSFDIEVATALEVAEKMGAGAQLIDATGGEAGAAKLFTVTNKNDGTSVLIKALTKGQVSKLVLQSFVIETATALDVLDKLKANPNTTVIDATGEEGEGEDAADGTDGGEPAGDAGSAPVVEGGEGAPAADAAPVAQTDPVPEGVPAAEAVAPVAAAEPAAESNPLNF